MLKKFEQFGRDDANFKLVFDHLRNIGLIALIFGAAAWKLRHIRSDWLGVLDYMVSILLAFVAFTLLALHQENFSHKLRNTRAGRWVKLLVVIIYAVIFAELIGYILGARG